MWPAVSTENKNNSNEDSPAHNKLSYNVLIMIGKIYKLPGAFTVGELYFCLKYFNNTN